MRRIELSISVVFTSVDTTLSEYSLIHCNTFLKNVVDL